jgi:tetratricopeptide (TPR) repeat protein
MFSRPGIRSAIARPCVDGLLDLAQPSAALSRAQQALADARGTAIQAVGLARLAETQAALGRRADAEATLGRLVNELDPARNKADARTVAHIRGVVALRSGDYTAALEQLKAAQNALSVRGAFVGAPNPHVPFWYALAQACLGAGDESQALEWFRRVTESGYERISAPVEYVRSFHAVGQLLEKRGDRAGAHDAYRRFVGYWKDGDLDRAQVADAKRKISTLPGAR